METSKLDNSLGPLMLEQYNMPMRTNQNTSFDVSVLVFFYNHAEFVTATLESIGSQTGVRLQIIIADDGSVDATRDLIEKWIAANPLVYCDLEFVEQNIGLIAISARAMKHVKGRYFVWFGGDDLILNGKLEKQMFVLETNPSATAVYHEARVFDSESNDTLYYYSTKRRYRSKLPILQYHHFLDTSRVLPQTLMYRSNRITPKHIDYRAGLAYDILFSMAATKGGSILPLQEVLVDYRKHPKSLTASREFSDGLHHLLQLLYVLAAERFPEIATRIACHQISSGILIQLQRLRSLGGASDSKRSFNIYFEFIKWNPVLVTYYILFHIMQFAWRSVRGWFGR
jgi:glycosyltransferase involved in cell wall biosynthesis